MSAPKRSVGFMDESIRSSDSIEKTIQSNDSLVDAAHSIDSIYEDLGSDQRELLHRLAALPSSFARWAVEKVAIVPISAKDARLFRWLIDLETLKELSLIKAEAGRDPSSICYGMSEYVRGYVLVRAGPEMEVHFRRAASLYLAYAMQHAGNSEALSIEEEGMIAGMEWACSAMEADDDASRMVCLYAWSLARPGSYLDGRPEMMARWLKAAIMASGNLKDGEAEVAFGRHLEEISATQFEEELPPEAR